jgi:hypothetical protein
MRARSSFYLAALAATALASPARAQEPVQPFDRVQVGLYGAANVNRNDFHSYWDAGYAGTLDASTPFYLGRASLMLRVGTNDAVEGAAESGFTSIFGALGWRLGRDLVPRVRTDVAFHVGLTEWVFSDEGESSVRYELELGAEAGVRADFEFAPRWHAIAEASYQLTYTYERIELAYVSIGLARTFGSPGWVRSVFE